MALPRETWSVVLVVAMLSVLTERFEPVTTLQLGELIRNNGSRTRLTMAAVGLPSNRDAPYL
jgi:hypothetical protein